MVTDHTKIEWGVLQPDGKVTAIETPFPDSEDTCAEQARREAEGQGGVAMKRTVRIVYIHSEWEPVDGD